MRVLAWLSPPPVDTDPRQTLQWLRRVEIVGGLGSLAAALVLWSAVELRWVLIALGVWSLSPWPGARAILRIAERNPDVLIPDPDRGRERAKLMILFQVPLYAAAGAIAGYVLDDWITAVILAVVIGSAAGFGGWLGLRRRPPAR